MKQSDYAPPKEYIGDGVYAAFEEGSILLTTEDGISVISHIYIGPEGWRALRRFAVRAGFEPETATVT